MARLTTKQPTIINYSQTIKMKTITILTLGLTLILTSCDNSNTSDKTTATGQVNASTEPTTPKMKVDIFNDIDKTRTVLSQNGIGQLKNWRSDDMGGYMSITDYFQFGNNSTGGMQNNLAYYLESDNEHCIKTAKLVLNINNKSESKQALTKFRETAEATYKSLSLAIPSGLLDAITKAENFQDSNDNFSTSLKLDKSNIDTWGLTIKTK